MDSNNNPLLAVEINKRSFLDGSKWQNVGVAERNKIDIDLTTSDIEKLNNIDLERLINRNALNIIRYSDSEWGNDYFLAVENISHLWKEVQRRFPK